MMLVKIQVPDWRDDLAGKVLVLPSTHVKNVGCGGMHLSSQNRGGRGRRTLEVHWPASLAYLRIPSQ